jgi:hypothetical protein
MTIIWILFAGSVIVLPGLALLALRWAVRHGEFNHLQKTALSIFDEEEPLGRMSDAYPAGAGSAGASPHRELQLRSKTAGEESRAGEVRKAGPHSSQP